MRKARCGPQIKGDHSNMGVAGKTPIQERSANFGRSTGVKEWLEKTNENDDCENTKPKHFQRHLLDQNKNNVTNSNMTDAVLAPRKVFSSYNGI